MVAGCKAIEIGIDFGKTAAVVGTGVINADCRRRRFCLMTSVQYFPGQFFEHRWPCDPMLLVYLCHFLVDERVESLLAGAFDAGSPSAYDQ